MKCLSSIFIFFLTVSTSFAQQAELSHIHLDKSFYVPGETIWYSLILPSTLQADAAIVELTLYSPAGVELERYHISVKDNLAEGYQRIQYDWPEGIYQLQVNAYDAESFDYQTLLNVPVPIYDDLTPPTEKPSAQAKVWKRPAGSINAELKVAIEMDRSTFSPRDAIQARITVSDQMGQPVEARLSVSVTDADLLPSERPVTYRGQAPVRRMQVDPLIRFDGTISVTENQASVNSFFLGAYLRPLDSLTFTIPSESGRFGLDLPRFFGEGRVQFADIRTAGIKITPTPPPPPPQVAEGLPYNEQIARYLTLSQQRKKMYQLYNTLEMTPDEKPFLQDSAFYPPDRAIRMDDFTSMEDIPRFFREVTTPLKFRKKKDRFIALMFNSDPYVRNFYPGPPLFIVDGQLTWNADWIAGLNIREVEEIALYFEVKNLNRRFGALGRHGVVIIRSRLGNFLLPEDDPGNIFQINGIQPPLRFPDIPPNEATETPVFRPQVYWDPMLPCNSAGQATLRFRQTDALSRFQIHVVASTKNGRIGSGTFFFDVQK